MTRSAQIRARADARTKHEAEKILQELGISPSAAINMFYRQIVMRRALPFSIEVPNERTRAAIDEARAGEAVTAAPDLTQLLTKLLTKRERTFDVADLVGSDPELVEVAERLARAAG